MNDEAAFVAAMAAAPQDDHLPLVFADWLDDRGDPRGPWVRNNFVHQWMRPDYGSPVPKLLESLKNDRRVIDVRRCAEVIGAPIVPGLVELLKHETPRVRQQACMCLRNIGKRAKDAVPALLEALSDSDDDVREQAAKALKDIGTAGVTDTEQLKTALTDGNWNVRRAASKMLGSMRAKGAVLQELVEKFDSPDAGDRAEVVEGLAQLGTADVIPALDKALDDPVAEVREKAVHALGRLKFPAAAGPLCRAMKDRIARVRTAAAQQFGSYRWEHPLTPEVVAALAALFDDKVPEVRAAAVAAVGTLGRGGEELTRALVPRVIQLLDDLSPEVQWHAMHALGQMARGSEHAVRALATELAAPHPEHREMAVLALAAVGQGDPVALAALAPLVGDPDENVADAATRGIAAGWDELPDTVAPALLARLAGLRAADRVHEVAGVLTALGRFKSPPAAVLEALREGARNPPPGLGAATAIDALGTLGPAAAGAAPDLAALLRRDDESEHYYTSQAAVRALARMGERGVAELSALLDDGNERVCEHIPQVVRDLGVQGAPLLPALVRALHAAGDRPREPALRALGALGTGAAHPDLLAAFGAAPPVHAELGTAAVPREFGSALLPHVLELMGLARLPEFRDHMSAFAEFFSRLAPAEEVREPLRELLRTAAAAAHRKNQSWDRSHTRQRCAEGLLKFKDASLVPDLAPLITDPDVALRREFVPKIARLDSPLIVPLMRQALNDPDDAVRLGALVLNLRGDSSPETVAALVKALEDRYPKVRRAAADALGALTVATDAVLAALRAATEDADKQTAARAGVALRKLTPKEPKAKKSLAAAKGKKKPE